MIVFSEQFGTRETLTTTLWFSTPPWPIRFSVNLRLYSVTKICMCECFILPGPCTYTLVSSTEREWMRYLVEKSKLTMLSALLPRVCQTGAISSTWMSSWRPWTKPTSFSPSARRLMSIPAHRTTEASGSLKYTNAITKYRHSSSFFRDCRPLFCGSWMQLRTSTPMTHNGPSLFGK